MHDAFLLASVNSVIIGSGTGLAATTLLDNVDSLSNKLLETHYAMKLGPILTRFDKGNVRKTQSIRYIDVIMTTIASQITSLTVVYSTVHSDVDQRKHQSSASLAFVWGIHRDRWIPRTKGQLRGKCFHLMTSSCNVQQLSTKRLNAMRCNSRKK